MRRLPSVFFISASILAIGIIYILGRIFLQGPVTTTVTIREGVTVREINELLRSRGVLVSQALPETDEGYLFPDTYEFFVPSQVGSIREKLRQNFEAKVIPILPSGMSEAAVRRTVIIASILEKEVHDPSDQRLVAGIIEKRLREGVPLQVDASICYLKESPDCLPIKPEDKKIDSPYNTYLYRGLPPGPISNPGLGAIEEALHPTDSRYWYYISDPETGKTIFAKTLDEQQANIVKYLSK